VLTYELTEADVGPWLDVLRRLDGVRSLASILEEMDVSLAAVRKHLEEALDFAVVRFVSL
jgi:asparagine synthase (glutamine-hydrolysing)